MNVHRTQIFAHANLVNLVAAWVNRSTLLKLPVSFFKKFCCKNLIQGLTLFDKRLQAHENKKKKSYFFFNVYS